MRSLSVFLLAVLATASGSQVIQNKPDTLMHLLTANTTTHTSTNQCEPGLAVCNVLAPYRIELPWHNSNQSYPQCYNATTYVCSGGNFLCPTAAPIQCGEGCFSNTTSMCQVNTTDYYSSKIIKKSDVSSGMSNNLFSSGSVVLGTVLATGALLF